MWCKKKQLGNKRTPLSIALQSTYQGMIKTAQLHRMVMDKHVCPYGIKSKWLLESRGFQVEDHHLTTRAQTDAFKSEHSVATTPQIFIDGKRVGGYTELRNHFDKPLRDPGATSYTPVLAVFAAAAALGLAISQFSFGHSLHHRRCRMVGRHRHGSARHAQAAGHRAVFLHVCRL